jgi:hypothetical protein
MWHRPSRCVTASRDWSSRLARSASCLGSRSRATARLILDLMILLAIEMTLGVQSEIDRRFADSEQHHQLRMTTARYESDAAQWRPMLVQPIVGSQASSRRNEYTALEACDG